MSRQIVVDRRARARWLRLAQLLLSQGCGRNEDSEQQQRPCEQLAHRRQKMLEVGKAAAAVQPGQSRLQTQRREAGRSIRDSSSHGCLKHDLRLRAARVAARVMRPSREGAMSTAGAEMGSPTSESKGRRLRLPEKVGHTATKDCCGHSSGATCRG